MKRQLITQVEWAKNHGFSKQYVQKLLKTGKIQLKEGKIDPFDADRRLEAFRDPIKAAIKAQKPAKKTHKQEQPTAWAEEDPDDELDEDISHLAPDEIPTSRLANELLRARIKKEREDGRLKQLSRQEKEKELINADDVRAAMQARAIAERESQLAWPRRVAANMAAEIGVDERMLLTILQKYMRQHLTERSQQKTGDPVELPGKE